MVTDKILSDWLRRPAQPSAGDGLPARLFPLQMGRNSSSAGVGTKPRILFLAEAVTLAHVARAVALARSLDPDQYGVHLAW